MSTTQEIIRELDNLRESNTVRNFNDVFLATSKRLAALEADNARLAKLVDGLCFAMQSDMRWALGGNAKASTPAMIRIFAEKLKAFGWDDDALHHAEERARMLEAAADQTFLAASQARAALAEGGT